jgi:hypothetical protein
MDYATLDLRGKARRLAPGNSVMDDWVRKIILFRRQEEAGRQLSSAGPEQDLTSVRRSGSGEGKQQKILFVQVFFRLTANLGRPGIFCRRRSRWSASRALIKVRTSMTG